MGMVYACRYRDCKNPAAYAVRMNLPARGWQLDSHRAMQIDFDFEVCALHYAGLRAADFRRASVVREAEDMDVLFVSCAAEPITGEIDVARAWLTRIPIGSPEHLSCRAIRFGQYGSA